MAIHKYSIVGLAVIVAAATASAALHRAELSFPGAVQASPGTSIVLPLTIASIPDQVSALQFDLEWDESAMVVSVVLADGPRAAGKDLYWVARSDKSARYLIVGLNRNTFGDQTLLHFLILVNRSTPPGDYWLKLTNVVAANPNGNGVPINAPVFHVSVQNQQAAATVDLRGSTSIHRE